MSEFTIVMAYFENGGMLDKHLEEWKNYHPKIKNKLSAVIIDDCSKRDPAEPHLQDVGFPINLFRITTDIPWNQNGARNLGMTHAEGWCLLTDMDHLLTRDQSEHLIKLKPKQGKYYKPGRVLANGDPYHCHPNTYILHNNLYWKAGGYDERFCGYYGTDATFRRQLQQAGECIELQYPYLTLYQRHVIPDASTTDYGRKDSKYHISNNPELSKLRRFITEPIPPLNFEWYQIC